jgi:hypothetical protein
LRGDEGKSTLSEGSESARGGQTALWPQRTAPRRHERAPAKRR